jgi:hypothetical protein
MNKYFEQEQQQARRQLWYEKTRTMLDGLVDADGNGRIPQFRPPWREVVWVLPALYEGEARHVERANRMLAGYNNAPAVGYKKLGEKHGKRFGIFQSNVMAHLLHRFGERMSPAARAVAEWHTACVFRTFDGSAQPDYKFHGANDNMPMMGTFGLILGGEALDNQQAVAHGVWNLNQVRRLLSRGAWMSEYNSSTYSPITLSGAAKIASYSRDPEIRSLARQVEHRLWAELLLHYHPGTLMQAGPHCRAYAIDCAGHNHSLQALFWLAFGTQRLGRDLLQSYFEPDGSEVLHFCGNPSQSIAEFTDMFDCELHLPTELAGLVDRRQYPATLKGRSEMLQHFDGIGGMVHTETYMEEEFSLGTASVPLCGGEQSNQLYATYRRTPEVKTFRDASTVFYRYLDRNLEIGEPETSEDGGFTGELFQKNASWVYAIQRDNVALMTCTPNLKTIPDQTDTLKLDVLFPAHYGRIRRSVIGECDVREGAVGESAEVVPVSVEVGEVYIHIEPLLPTNLPRRAAIRFNRQHQYEILELVNYEGPERHFSRLELSRVLNGMVFTIAAKSKHASLADFHRQMSACLVQDYLYCGHRTIAFQREDVDFDLVVTTNPFGVQTEAIDGRPIERPQFQSNQLDVSQLPFMSGKVERNVPFFPWNELKCISFENSWIIGSRGIDGEANYQNRAEDLLKHV